LLSTVLQKLQNIKIIILNKNKHSLEDHIDPYEIKPIKRIPYNKFIDNQLKAETKDLIKRIKLKRIKRLRHNKPQEESNISIITNKISIM